MSYSKTAHIITKGGDASADRVSEVTQRCPISLSQRSNPSLFREDWVRETDSNRIILSAIGPSSLFVYWEVNLLKRNLICQHFQTDWTHLPLFLRIYDVSDILFDGYNAHELQEHRVFNDCDHWYLHHVHPNRHYLVDFGTKSTANGFFTVLRSNVVQTPPTSIAHNPH